MATAMTTRARAKHPFVTRKKGTCGGKPIIAGTRIKVSQIAIEYERLGWSPDEIIQAHPHLTLAQVHDALSYYYTNSEEVHAQFRAEDATVEKMRKLYPRSALEEKRAALHLHR